MIKNRSLKFALFILLALASDVIFSVSAEAGLVRRWESGDTTDPTAVEAINGTSFAATAAFTDWAQTQSVSSGAGLSVGMVYSSTAPVQTASVWLGNFQTTAGTNVTVTAGSYIAISYGTVASNFTVTINSTYVSEYHANYHETNAGESTGYVVVYFKLKEFTINAGTDPNVPDVKLADLDAGSIAFDGLALSNITHTNLMDENTDPNGSVYVSSGLADSTPEIPPQALPAVYSGLGGAMLYIRGRMRRKKRPSSPDISK